MIPLRDANPTRRLPVVTIGLIVACFVVFAYELGTLATGEDALNAFVTTWGVVPADLLGAWDAGDYASQETLTLITSQFLHGGWLHLLGNMLFLWIFGNNVEDALGRIRFLLWYVAAGLAATAAQTWVTLHYASLEDASIPNIGASGAIAGVMGAYFVLYPHSRVLTLIPWIFIQVVEMPAIVLLGFWFLMQLFSAGAIAVTASTHGGGVAFMAHVAGFVLGAIGVLVFRKKALAPWERVDYY